MLVKDFIPLIHGALWQMGTTLFISDKNLINFMNLAMQDILNYEGISWGFQYRHEVSFRLDGLTDDVFIFEIPNWDKEKLKRIAYLNIDGHTLNTYDFKQHPDAIKRMEDLFFIYNDTKLYMKNQLWVQRNVSIGYFVNPVPLTSSESEIPLPNYMHSPLFDYTMSYLMLPHGQYGEEKDHRFFERAQMKMQSIAKSNNAQSASVTTKIK